jgi:hypothetical protein
MMQNEASWTKWVILSVCEHAKTHFGSDAFYVRGLTVMEKNKPPEKYELVYMGPDIITHNQSEATIHLVINCQVSTVRTASNLETHLRRVGKAQTLLSSCIPIYRYGSDSIVDNKSRFGQLQRCSNIETLLQGAIDPVSTIERSTVEAAYKLAIEE